MSFLNSKNQSKLVSGTNIKTINGNSILGSGNLTVTSSDATWGTITGTLSTQTDLQTALNTKQNTLVSGTNIKTINGNSLLGSGNLVISATPQVGTLILLSADETQATGTGNATHKTYVLPSNTYSRIIIESECEFQQNVNLNASCNFVIYVGSTSKRVVECFASATGAGDFMRDGISVKYSEAITAGATITLRTENTLACSYQVNSFRIYGVV